MDAVTATIKKRHPSSVLSRVQAKCTSDAMAEYHLNKLNEEDEDGMTKGLLLSNCE